jgi:hypothetical protein
MAFSGFKEYMAVKQNKLIKQAMNGAQYSSDLFEGLCFYFNGIRDR